MNNLFERWDVYARNNVPADTKGMPTLHNLVVFLEYNGYSQEEIETALYEAGNVEEKPVQNKASGGKKPRSSGKKTINKDSDVAKELVSAIGDSAAHKILGVAEDEGDDDESLAAFLAFARAADGAAGTQKVEYNVPPVKQEEEPGVEPAEEPAEEPGVEPAEEPAEEPGVEPAEEPGVEPAEEPSAQGTDDSFDELLDVPPVEVVAATAPKPAPVVLPSMPQKKARPADTYDPKRWTDPTAFDRGAKYPGQETNAQQYYKHLNLAKQYVRDKLSDRQRTLLLRILKND